MPSPPLQNPHSNVLLLLFPGFNTLDVNAPLEVLRKSGSSTIFAVTVAAEAPPSTFTTSCEGARVVADVVLNQDLIDNLEQYDLLIVPGAPSDAISAQLNKGLDDPFFKLIHRFASLGPGPAPLSRICFSICTGALFLGSLGIFNDLQRYRFCTSHWGVYSQLQQINDRVAGGPDLGARVVPARFVDSGLNQSGVRIISSGGISCALDASLHVVKIRAEALLGPGTGEGEARETAERLDYRCSLKSEGVVFDVDWTATS